MEEKDIELTDKEKEFCELYVNGDKAFAGQGASCYIEVFGEESKNIALSARALLNEERISEYLGALLEKRKAETEAIAVKLQVAETLRSVMSETASVEYIDKFGVPLSPAPLRAVAVNAAKALMELYPLKHSHSQAQKGDGNGGNIVFNVIVPQNAGRNETEDKP